jgi:hypothetical protein
MRRFSRAAEAASYPNFLFQLPNQLLQKLPLAPGAADRNGSAPNWKPPSWRHAEEQTVRCHAVKRADHGESAEGQSATVSDLGETHAAATPGGELQVQ